MDFRTDAEAEEYRQSIRQLRARLGTNVQNGAFLTLRRSENIPEHERYFGVQIAIGEEDSIVFLLIRSVDLYIVGWSRGPNAPWQLLTDDYKKAREFLLHPTVKDNDIQFRTEPPEPANLPGNYTPLGRVAKRGISETPLGQVPLENAVRLLLNSDNKQDQARGMLVVCQMVAEALRFTLVTDHIIIFYYNAQPPTAEMMHFIKNWDNCSKIMVAYAAQQNPSPFRNGDREYTYQELGNRVSLVKSH